MHRVGGAPFCPTQSLRPVPGPVWPASASHGVLGNPLSANGDMARRFRLAKQTNLMIPVAWPRGFSLRQLVALSFVITPQ